MKSDIFTSVRVEGSILPTDLLQRVAAGDARLEGLRAEDYGLVGEKLNEATNHAWSRLLGAWEAFKTAREKLPASDPGHKVTADRWLLPFWKVLGYGPLDKAQPFVFDEKTYPVSHTRYHSPIHLVGFRQDLDKRVETEGKQFSPHGLVQEFLNRSESHLWGFVSNGLKLRILRDNIRLTRQAFVEFDLQAMFEGKQYADFALLWRVCHESRVNAEKPERCWLELWSKVAAEQGLRALDQLRNGVEECCESSRSGVSFLPCKHGTEDGSQAKPLAARRIITDNYSVSCIASFSCLSPRTGSFCLTRQPLTPPRIDTAASTQRPGFVAWRSGSEERLTPTSLKSSRSF